MSHRNLGNEQKLLSAVSRSQWWHLSSPRRKRLRDERSVALTYMFGFSGLSEALRMKRGCNLARLSRAAPIKIHEKCVTSFKLLSPPRPWEPRPRQMYHRATLILRPDCRGARSTEGNWRLCVVGGLCPPVFTHDHSRASSSGQEKRGCFLGDGRRLLCPELHRGLRSAFVYLVPIMSQHAHLCSKKRNVLGGLLISYVCLRVLHHQQCLSVRKVDSSCRYLCSCSLGAPTQHDIDRSERLQR